MNGTIRVLRSIELPKIAKCYFVFHLVSNVYTVVPAF